MNSRNSLKPLNCDSTVGETTTVRCRNDHSSITWTSYNIWCLWSITEKSYNLSGTRRNRPACSIALSFQLLWFNIIESNFVITMFASGEAKF